MNIEDAYGIFICSNKHIKGYRFFITCSPFLLFVFISESWESWESWKKECSKTLNRKNIDIKEVQIVSKRY